MKIKNVISQNRRDFSAVMVCEFCGYETENDSCYDDRNFHDNVIPTMECKECGKSTLSGGGTVAKTKTKYPDGLQL